MPLRAMAAPATTASTTPITAAAPTTAAAVDRFPIPVVELRGSSAEMGIAQGQQLGGSIRTLHDQYLIRFVGDGMKRLVALSAASLFEARFRPEHRDEVAALAKSTHLDEKETALAQCFLDLTDMAACSTITLSGRASPDGVARFGRNLDFSSLNIADKYTTVFVFHPDDGRYAFASVGWPGMIGVLSGMNEYGLCIANMEVPRGIGLPRAQPYTLLYRTVLERCKTTAEAIDLLKQTPIQTANNIMLMDASGNRAVVELSPEAVHVRQAADAMPLISTNHQRNQDADTPGLCDRYDYLHDTALADFGRVDRPMMQQMLARVGNHTTLQSMIFEPAHRVLYLSAGQAAANGTMHRLDLTSYFQSSGVPGGTASSAR